MLGYVSPRLYRGDTKRYDFRYVTLFVQFAFNGQSCEQRTPALLRMAGFSALVVPEETSITSPFGYKKKKIIIQQRLRTQNFHGHRFLSF